MISPFGAAADAFLSAALTSFSMILPAGPVPEMVEISRARVLASFFALGEAIIFVPATGVLTLGAEVIGSCFIWGCC